MELRKTVIVCVATAATGLLLSGCATEAYVDEQVSAVNGRVEALGGRVGALETRVADIDSRHTAAIQAAQARADEAHKLAEGKLLHTTISENDVVNFATNSWKLSDEAKATLTAFADRLKTENKNVWIECEGHGDPRGSTMANRVLGEKRALEVRRFLIGQGIPVDHVDTVSWGEERPAAQGNSADALAASRRVVLRVTS